MIAFIVMAVSTTVAVSIACNHMLGIHVHPFTILLVVVSMLCVLLRVSACCSSTTGIIRRHRTRKLLMCLAKNHSDIVNVVDNGTTTYARFEDGTRVVVSHDGDAKLVYNDMSELALNYKHLDISVLHEMLSACSCHHPSHSIYVDNNIRCSVKSALKF